MDLHEETGAVVEYHWWNIIDVLSLSTLVLVFALRCVVFLFSLCGSASDDGGPSSFDAADYLQLQSQTEDKEYAAIWASVYGEHCAEPAGQHVLWIAQLLLALDAIPCFLRVLNWMTVWSTLGTLSYSHALRLEPLTSFKPAVLAR